MNIQVQGITVRFRRTIQVTQYEPAEAEVTLHGITPEGETLDVLKETNGLLVIAAEEVHESLGLPRNTKMPARARAAGTKREASTATPGSVVTHNGTRVEGGQTKQLTVAGAAPAGAGDIPEVQSAPATTPAKPTQTATVAPASDGIPEAAAPQKAAAAPQQAAAAATPASADDAAKAKALANLSAWIGDFVKSGTVTAQEIKTIYPKYNIASVNNLQPNQKEPFYADVLDLLAKKKEAASL